MCRFYNRDRCFAVNRQLVASGLIRHYHINSISHTYPFKVLLSSIMPAIIVCITIHTTFSHLLRIKRKSGQCQHENKYNRFH